MLDRMQAGRMNSREAGGAAGQLMNKFGGLITKQRKLLDDTFSAGRKQGQGETNENSTPHGSGDWDNLSTRQLGLRDELQKLLQDMQGLSGQQSPSQEPLKDAGQSMDDAIQSLQNADPSAAADAQSRALDQLRKGAQALSKQLQDQNGHGNQLGSRGHGDQRDPLGRPLPDDSLDSGSVEDIIPKDIDVQRARKIIEELRRRLGETTRPPNELDYIERLLEKQ
jgi:hypothetical protein